MYRTRELSSVDIDCHLSVELVEDYLMHMGPQIVPCFGLRVAHGSPKHCSYPHHRTQRCESQFSVPLIYETNEYPVTLVAHGSGGRTFFSSLSEKESKDWTVLESFNANILISRLNKDIIYQNSPRSGDLVV